MTLHRRRLLLALGAAALPVAARSQASVRYEGQSFPTTVRVAGAELRLNGTGVRQVAWFKGYLAALYLAAPASTAAQAVALPGAKRLHLRMLHDVPATEFSKALRKGVVRNVEAGQFAVMAERVERFARAIDAVGHVHEKDVVDLDFEPGRGLVMYINAAQRGGPFAGEDLYAGLLRAFVGDRPYDEKLRAGLLGARA